MKKCRHLKEIDITTIHNPVAKHAHRFNKAKIFSDKTQYRRKDKHAKQEAFPIVLTRTIRNASCTGLSSSII